ncbi:MAG TPA: efflux RND transporter periplasmic adaptor subunit [Candidatus Polarisedimenticolia bacterium]
MMAFRTGRRMLVLGSIVTILAAGAVAGGLSFKRSRAHRGAAGAPQGGAVLASTKTKEEPGKTAIPVSVAVIARGPVSSYITSTANLVPEQEVKILAEAEGRVAELHVEEGTRVGRGQILASLAHEDAEIALKKAELRSSNTRSAYERAASLLADNLVSREAYDRTALDSEVAAQELAEARFRLEKTFIRAPFGGHITNREIKLGQHVRPGDSLFTVSDFDPLTARIYLPEKDVYGLQEGRDVRITLKANEATRFHGRIRQISPVVDTGTGTVKITVEATATPPEVRPGAFVTLDIVRELHAQAVLVPREAVIRELQDSYVFVARGGTAEKRPVSLGLEEGGRIEAVSGLSPGEQVIIAGQGGLRQGSPIKVIPIREASDLGAVADRTIRG